MKKYKFAKGLFAAVLLATSMISCSEDVMDGINVDRNHAAEKADERINPMQILKMQVQNKLA
jgi:hypothetical protein